MAIAALVVITACTSEQRASYERLKRTSEAFESAYPREEATVNLHNQRYLYVTFVNSPLNGQKSELQIKRALEAAKLAVAKLGAGEVEGAVRFSRRRGALGFYFTDQIASYSFRTDGNGVVTLEGSQPPRSN